MEAKVVGHKEENCGVEVYDERENRHVITIEWNGRIQRHSQESYPHDPDDRTDEEQRIMCQVEERARYAAQQEFPEADILDPLWDPEHIEEGLEALTNYPLAEFQEQFRDYYEALQRPSEFVDDPDMDPETSGIAKPFRVRDGQVVEVSDIEIVYERTDGTAHSTGKTWEYPREELIVCSMPRIAFEDHITFEEHFPDFLVNHLMAQIRDIYLNMGEQPPREYRVQGHGKLDIYGDEDGSAEELLLEGM
ncbi:hypothetical protein Hrd1104_11415 [Halorhabdus sp. CBA1104]|nr:hypothetical protein Hrd1104_11415 [Halorhabdus sp. CBA1104]